MHLQNRIVELLEFTPKATLLEILEGLAIERTPKNVYMVQAAVQDLRQKRMVVTDNYLDRGFALYRLHSEHKKGDRYEGRRAKPLKRKLQDFGEEFQVSDLVDSGSYMPGRDDYPLSPNFQLRSPTWRRYRDRRKGDRDK